jgi:hypothetical protein
VAARKTLKLSTLLLKVGSMELKFQQNPDRKEMKKLQAARRAQIEKVM